MQPAQHKLDPISLGYESGPANADLYLSMAQLSYQAGKVEEARGHYQKALSLEPTHLKSLLGLAHLEDREGRMEEALKNYQLAAGANPQNAQVLNDLALCHARLGQFASSFASVESSGTLSAAKGSVSQQYHQSADRTKPYR